MTTDYDDETETVATPAPVVDRFGDVLALLAAVRNAKVTEVALKRLRRLERDIAAAEAKLAALTAKAEQTAAALADREAATAAAEAALTQREDEFTAAREQARYDLRRYYNEIADADRGLRYRVLVHADLAFNPTLQDLPDWSALRLAIPGLPPDPPPVEREVAPHLRIDSFSDTSDDPHADRHGNDFLGSLTRSIEHKRGTA